MSNYYPNIPLATDLPSVSQGQMLTNFATLDAVFGVDHGAFSADSDVQGRHNQVTFAGIQSPSTPSSTSQSILFTQTNTVVGLATLPANIPQLVWKSKNNSVDYTRHVGAILAWGIWQGGASFYTFGCSIAYGGAGTYNISFTSALQNSSVTYAVIATSTKNISSTCCVSGKTNAGFTISTYNNATSKSDSDFQFLVLAP